MKIFSAVALLTLLLLFTVTGLLLQGCGPRQVVYKTPSKEIPATQRPYRINGKTYYPIDSSHGYRERGIASWYGGKFHGRKTACGETYNMHGRTAAHKTLPMQTMVLVRNLENGRETVVRINDRGPFSRGRIIDLSYTAALELGMIRNGTARTEIIALGEAAGPKDNRERLKFQDFDKGNFFIQVGAFLDRNNAENLARLFVDQGLQVTIQPYTDNSRTFHRVQVYAGTSLHLARQFAARLLDKGFTGSFVIAR